MNDHVERDMKTGVWIFTDCRGDKWRLTPTGDPSMPLIIQIVDRVQNMERVRDE